jgi:hypothetical protein
MGVGAPNGWDGHGNGARPKHEVVLHGWVRKWVGFCFCEWLLPVLFNSVAVELFTFQG